MKQFSLACVALLFAVVSSGCHHNLARNGCDDGCESHGGGENGGGGKRMSLFGGGGGRDGGGLAHGGQRGPHVPRLPHGQYHQTGPAGPPTPTYSYPYYTMRAPRDFLLDNPPSIGR